VQAFCYASPEIAMSGWGCRHQYEEQCLRMRKECKPGMPGCVLRGKVQFIKDVEKESAEAGARAQSSEPKRTGPKASRAPSSERKRTGTSPKASRAPSSERKR
jgi:hypothetical protein